MHPAWLMGRVPPCSLSSKSVSCVSHSSLETHAVPIGFPQAAMNTISTSTTFNLEVLCTHGQKSGNDHVTRTSSPSEVLCQVSQVFQFCRSANWGTHATELNRYCVTMWMFVEMGGCPQGPDLYIMYIYIYIYVHIYIYIHVYVYVYVYAFVWRERGVCVI